MKQKYDFEYKISEGTTFTTTYQRAVHDSSELSKPQQILFCYADTDYLSKLTLSKPNIV
jgi:hypothetical protein